MKGFFLASYTLWQREMAHFFRQRSRVLGAFLPPDFFWFLIGSGLKDSFRLAGSGMTQWIGGGNVNYLQYFFPGTIALIVLFASIFTSISIIEDRHEGFLQSVLVSPQSRGSLVLGKIMGATTVAWIQGAVFLILTPAVGVSLHWKALIYLLIILLSISFGLSGLGFLMAWRLDSSQGFHAAMNLLLFPLWLLSGALFPLSGAAGWIRWVMRINPLTYGVAAMQSSFLVHGQPMAPWLLSPAQCLGVIVLFGGVTFGLSVASVR